MLKNHPSIRRACWQTTTLLVAWALSYGLTHYLAVMVK